MSTVDLRVPADLFLRMAADVTQRFEWAGYLLCGAMRDGDRWTLLGREWCSVPDRFQLRDTPHGMSWHPDFDVEMLNRAQRLGLAGVVVHHHGGPSPSLSRTDRTTRDSLMPFLSDQARGKPHGFVVLGDGALTGDAYVDGAHVSSIDWMRVSGAALVDWGGPSLPELLRSESRRYDRSIRAFGVEGQARLKRARVGLIGCGGGGAHVAQQLAYLGIGNFVLVDADSVDESNLNRLVGAFPATRISWLDRLLRRSSGDVGEAKVEVIARMIRRINPTSLVQALNDWFPSEQTADALRACDVLVACVDKLQVRDDLNRFAKRFLIPMLDVGLQIHGTDAGGVQEFSIPGRVTKVLSDGPCLRCQGVVDDGKLEYERGGRPAGYTGPAGIPDPAVVTLNGIVASIAATEVLQLLTGFAQSRGPNAGWIYSGTTGEVERVHKSTITCEACQLERGAGQVLSDD